MTQNEFVEKYFWGMFFKWLEHWDIQGYVFQSYLMNSDNFYRFLTTQYGIKSHKVNKFIEDFQECKMSLSQVYLQVGDMSPRNMHTPIDISIYGVNAKMFVDSTTPEMILKLKTSIEKSCKDFELYTNKMDVRSSGILHNIPNKFKSIAEMKRFISAFKHEFTQKKSFTTFNSTSHWSKSHGHIILKFCENIDCMNCGGWEVYKDEFRLVPKDVQLNFLNAIVNSDINPFSEYGSSAMNSRIEQLKKELWL